jgi:hypothetical protein
MHSYKKVSKHLGCCWWFGGMIPTLAGAFGSTPLFNEASGGTVTTFSSGGKNYKRHTFTGSGSKTLTVVRSPNLFTIMVLGAGGGGSAGYIAGIGVGGAYGGGGGAFEGLVTLSVGANAGSVGSGGSGGAYPANGGSPGGSTSFASKTGGGGQGGKTEYSGGGSPGSGDGPTGTGGLGATVTQSPPYFSAGTFPGETLRNAYSLGATGKGGGGGPQDGPSGGGTGASGAIVITYEVA